MASKHKALSRGSSWRKWRGALGFGLTGVATVISLGALFSILGYLIHQGIGAINWSFIVREPAAVGEAGGGIAPSLLGTLILVAISIVVGVPLGIGVGIYRDERDAFERVAKPGKTYEPDPKLSARYAQGFSIYRELYPSLKSVSHRLFDAFLGG